MFRGKLRLSQELKIIEMRRRELPEGDGSSWEGGTSLLVRASKLGF